MITLNVKEASDKLPDLIENTIAKREPVLIVDKNNNAVLKAESDWQEMGETFHILSVLGMRDAIEKGLSENLESMSRELNWWCDFKINPRKLRRNQFRGLSVPTFGNCALPKKFDSVILKIRHALSFQRGFTP